MCFLCLLFQPSHGQQGISTDGTIGTAGAQTLIADSSGAYTIDEALGQKSDNGHNLFHSFDQFNINIGESATFIGDNSIQNVISRVTGGNASTIDGLLRSTIGSADLYFANPAGVIFGPNARLDLPGAFHVSTADFLRMDNDDLFYSEPMDGEVMSIAAPTAFGFLDIPEGGVGVDGVIEVDGAELEIVEGETLSLVGRTIDIYNGTQLTAEAGQVNLVSAASVGEAEFVTENGDLDSSGLDVLGGISVEEYSEVNANGVGGGRIFIRGGEVFIEDSTLAAQTTGDEDGRGVDIEAEDSFSLVRSSVNTSTNAAGKSGDISITGKSSGNLKLVGRAGMTTSTFDGNGNAGNIKIENIGILTLEGGSHVSSFTRSDANGDAGDVNISAVNQLFLDDSSIFSGVEDAAGDAGDITLADISEIDLSDSFIASDVTFGRGDGGTISVTNVGTLSLYSGQFSSSIQENSAGTAGDIKFDQVDKIFLRERSFIASKLSEDSSGSAGNISINGSENFILELLGESEISSSILSGSVGNAGKVEISHVGSILIKGDSKITSSTTHSNGNAGSVMIEDVDSIVVNGNGLISTASFNAVGYAGTVIFDDVDTIHLNDNSVVRSSVRYSRFMGEDTAKDPKGGVLMDNIDALVLNGGTITAETNSEIPGGYINIHNVNEVLLENGAQINAVSRGSGKAGSIFINAPEEFAKTIKNQSLSGAKAKESLSNVFVRSGSSISTTTRGVGDAGSIFIGDRLSRIGEINLNRSFIESNTSNDSSGNGGEVYIQHVDSIFLQNESYISSETYLSNGDAGKVTIFEVGSIVLEEDMPEVDYEEDMPEVDYEEERGSYISSETYLSNGNAGKVEISHVGSILIKGDSLITSSTTDSVGNAGGVMIEGVDSIVVNGNGLISTASTNAEGYAGTVTFDDVDTIHLNDDSVVGSFVRDSRFMGEDTAEDVPKGGVLMDNIDALVLNGGTITAETNSEIPGGYIKIHNVNEVLLENGAEIDAFTKGSGDGGTISVTTKNLLVDKGAILADSGESGGSSGQINVVVEDQFRVIGVGANSFPDNGKRDVRGTISVTTEGNGNSGLRNLDNGIIEGINITAGDIIIEQYAAVVADTHGSGQGGNINMNAQTIELKSGGRVESNSSEAGQGGRINVTVEESLKLSDSAKISASAVGDGTGDGGRIEVDVGGDIRLSGDSKIETSSMQSNAGSITIKADGEIYVEDNSKIDIQAGQGWTDNDLEPSSRFQLNNPSESELAEFLGGFERPEFTMEADGDVRIVNGSEISAESGLISGDVRIESKGGSVIIENSVVTLESDQIGMNLADVWNSDRFNKAGVRNTDEFRKDFGQLFSSVTLLADKAIELTNSEIITNAGLLARDLDEQGTAPAITGGGADSVSPGLATFRALAISTGPSSDTDTKIRGFGGSIDIVTGSSSAQLISLLNSNLQAESYTMGGNVGILGNDYLVNNSDIIAKAQAVGGDYTIDAQSWLQSLDSSIDLSGAQEGQIQSNSSLIDLGAALAKLSSDFLQSTGFSRASCARYYAKKQSSFIVAPPEVNSTNVDDYLPSVLPAALFEMDFDAISVDESEWDVQEFP